jgi:hypothetical protein
MAVNKRLLQGPTGAGGLVPSENFKVVTFTGDGTSSKFIEVGFTPDFVWIKGRNASSEHKTIDSSRTAGCLLYTNLTNAEDCNSSHAVIETNGFNVKGNPNVNGREYVAWCWKANGGTTSSNTDGDITSTVQANTDAGFSIVQYDGDGQNGQTVGHSLSSEPEVIIIKSKTFASHWPVYHKYNTGSSGSPETEYVRINSTNATATTSVYWGNTAPTSSVFSIGTDTDVNKSGETNIAYCFHSVDGFSKFGSYTGNGSANGPIVETGFEPAFIMVKRTDASDNWLIFDNKRSPSDPRNLALIPNSSSAELTGNLGDGFSFLSNGFKVVSSDGGLNDNGGTYIYMAFAADPDTEAPTLADSFEVKTYTGNSGTQSITGLDFSPNLVWIKERGPSAENHNLFDTLRGATKFIQSNNTNAESTGGATLTSFDADGFTLGLDNEINDSASTYVAWAWKADDNEPTIFGGPAVAVYKFEDNANDVTTNNNGTANNITYATGKFNKAAVFNGSTGDIDLPADIESSTMAVSLWAYLDDNAPTLQFIIEFENGYALNFTDFSNGKLAAQYANSNASHTLSNSALSNGQWYHIAANFRSGASDLWIDGVKQSGGTISDYLTADQNTIGSRRSGEFFDGMIDQVRIYNGNFQQEQVDELYAETASDNDDLELGGPPKSIVSANANAGFSIVKYEGTGSNTKVPHGLGQKPDFVVIKHTNDTSAWVVFSDATGTFSYSYLNNTDAFTAYSAMSWDSSVINLNAGNDQNGAGDTHIAYFFTSISGYSDIGSYTGNGSSTSVTTGFQPDFVMLKRTSAIGNWNIWDSVRNGSSSSNDILYPNKSDAETDAGSGRYITFNSNGFTIYGDSGDSNANEHTYIYMAFKIN